MSNLPTWNARSRTFARTATIGKRNGTIALLSRMDPTENATVTPRGRAYPNVPHAWPGLTKSAVTHFITVGKAVVPSPRHAPHTQGKAVCPKETYNYPTTAYPEPRARQVGVVVFNTDSTSDHLSCSSSTSTSTSVWALVAQTWRMTATCPNYEHIDLGGPRRYAQFWFENLLRPWLMTIPPSHQSATSSCAPKPMSPQHLSFFAQPCLALLGRENSWPGQHAQLVP